MLNALDYGITERDFWEMTPIEVKRAVDSKAKVKKIEMQEKASYDYILAQLITKGVGIVLGSKESFPEIHTVYTGLFDDVKAQYENKAKETKMNLSAMRFKQFAQNHNNRMKQQGVQILSE